ncbi:MAG: hypothetical protein A3G34_08460 [Candidatus Lindowbacteria bacterium RIFCSPLOWO2_12_FULL_62_27]|nr:MAG: hypothetical protein A3G34_08460 [Candidatus Lindowbacteria bacterium RIFCSPLOWO2_12_FULL_62_27]OGH62931.1 MAG: hypothetical protein A3I06_13705 [Candidatus Lindowbacteria bacterium RIFCSPLOWO2_02_FULL_62_12]
MDERPDELKVCASSVGCSTSLFRRIPDSGYADIRVCVVGGGHAAHALMALLPSRGLPTSVFTSFGNEAARIRQGLAEQGSIVADFETHNSPAGVVRGTPVRVTDDPAEAIPDANVILIPLPSFAYVDVLTAIAPHIAPGTFIGATPGQGGFDYIARRILGDAFRRVTIFSIMSMPFNCRITEFGKAVHVQQFEDEYTICAVPQDRTPDAMRVVARLLGKKCLNGGHFLSCTLFPLNANIHPQRMYCVLKNWKPGEVLPRNPLFYEEMDAEAGALMEHTSAEIQELVKLLSTRYGLEMHVPTIYESEYISFPDPSCKTADQLFAKSPGYKGFKCPLKPVDGGWAPDFSNRYFAEDIPYGLCVWKGISELAGIPTPTIDFLLHWAQKQMGREYLLANGRLAGRDTRETSAPRRFGYSSIDDLVL